jgi:carbonic anhydrase/acetyltransferase-like protein (isoleucine patch superfamily)
MALILPVNGVTPIVGDKCFLAENATITGEVIMGNECSVWFNAVIRGDVNSVTIGNRVNVQDLAVIHCTYKKAATRIGDNVSIGHAAIVHGCTLENNVLIGMGAIVMDHAVIGENSMIAAGSVVLENTIVEPGSIWAGVPAKKIKQMTAEHFREMNERIANNYVMYKSWYEK